MTERRDLEDGRAWLLARLDGGVHPLDGLDPNAARTTIAQLQGLEPEPWTAAWGALADRFAAAAEHAEGTQVRREALMQAYRAAFMGRYPTLNHPLKERLCPGDPKTARVFDGGHMGEGPVIATIGAWLDGHLRSRAPRDSG